MLDSLAIVLYWYRRIFLAPLGFTAQVELVHDAARCKIGQDGKTLLDVLQEGCPSLLGYRAWYSPSFWLCQSGHFQTAYGALGNFTRVFKVEYERKYLNVPDGGQICVDITPSLHEVPPDNRPILVCTHGLTGGSHESYVRTVFSVLCKPIEQGGHGWRGVVVNSRGCANGPLKTPKLYHAGATYDIKNAMLYISNLFPDSPIYGIGFSLGAGMMTKYLGTEGETSPMKAGVVLGTPWDLMQGHIELQRSLRGLYYSKAMAGNMQRVFNRHLRVLREHPTLDIDAVLANPNMTLYEFDCLVTRVCGGFDTAEQYYRTQSSKNYVDSIRVPFLSLNAIDDPIATIKGAPVGAVERNPHLCFALTKHGGHLGWFSGPFSFITKKRWVAKPVIEWLVALHEADPAPKKHKGIKQPRTPRVGDKMVIDVNDPETGFQEVGEDTIMGGDDAGEASALMGGL